MKIARAMKKIARVKGELKEIKHRLSGCISTLASNDFNESFSDLLKLLDSKTAELVKLKAGVMYANVKGNIFPKIIELGEMKSRMDFLKELDPKTGSHESGYRETISVYKAQITLTERNKMIERCQAEINERTDALDEFNAKTDIEDVVAQ